MPCSLKVELELLARPDQVVGQFGVLVPSQPLPLLDGDVAEVLGAGVERAGVGQQGAGALGVPGCWGTRVVGTYRCRLCREKGWEQKHM